MKTKKRIEKEAEEFAYKGILTRIFNQDRHTGYIAGAETNYQKGWNEAIESCIEFIKEHDCFAKHELESLKIK